MNVAFIPSENNIADLSTKVISNLALRKDVLECQVHHTAQQCYFQEELPHELVFMREEYGKMTWQSLFCNNQKNSLKYICQVINTVGLPCNVNAIDDQ